MTKQEKSIRRYMEVLAKEIISGDDFERAVFCIDRLFRLRGVLDDIEKRKEVPKEK